LVSLLVGCVVGWSVGWLDAWLVGWLVGWVGGCLVGWAVGWLVGWVSGRLIGWWVHAVAEDLTRALAPALAVLSFSGPAQPIALSPTRPAAAHAPRAPPPQALAPALAALSAAAVDLVAPIFRSVAEAAEGRLLRLHATPAYTGAVLYGAVLLLWWFAVLRCCIALRYRMRPCALFVR
jgi:hypothetical protein